MGGLARIIVLLLTFGVLYSGPVAACVCADEPSSAMPCCPDEPQDGNHSNVGWSDAVMVACDPAPADLLPAGSQELPPVVISTAAPPPWQTHGPPPSFAPTAPQPHHARPIYLVTLRLRN